MGIPSGGPKDRRLRYVIVGGCGFLGQHLIQLLLRNRIAPSDITVIDKVPRLSPDRLLRAEDFTGTNLFLGIDCAKDDHVGHLLAGAHVVFHLAAAIAYGRKNRELLEQANVENVRKIASHARRHGVKKLVYVSSIAALGCRDDKDSSELADEDVTNDWSRDTHSHYAMSKYRGEREALAAADLDLQVNVAIPGILLGPGPACEASRLPFEIALRKKWSVAPQGGTSYVDVRDLAHGLWILSQPSAKGGRYLFVSNNLEHKHFLQAIARATGRRLRVFAVPRFLAPALAWVASWLELLFVKQTRVSREAVAKIFKYRYFSNQRARADLGWRPAYSLQETILDTVGWQRRVT